MSLAEYNRKRNFRRTPEPGPGGTKVCNDVFVVQKHDASRLHYDFRLEMDGILKSWAVPKGPSIDPSVKSLAVLVEDHPLSYANFEGTIPKGEYGGGTVMVWDYGTWEAEGDAQQGFERGKLSFQLHGEKLKGKWSLVRMSGKAGDDGKNWLLIKGDDLSASKTTDIRKTKPNSVLSGRNLKQIANTKERVWANQSASSKQAAGTKQSPSASTSRANRQESLDSPGIVKIASLAGRLPGAKKRSLPQQFKPQLATLIAGVPQGDSWIHEMKFDGYRLLAFVEKGGIRLVTRNGNDWTQKFPSLVRALKAMPFDSGILDGEVVCLDDQGIANYQMLQNALRHANNCALCYYVFDLPFCGGYDLTGVPLSERKSVLEKIIAAKSPQASEIVRYSDHIAGQGTVVLANACQFGLEGIVSKRIDSAYSQGRSPAWVKVKCLKRQEFVIGGYTNPTGMRVGFGALLLGYYSGDKLVYAGRVGTGFNATSLRQIHGALKKLKSAVSPFDTTITRAQSRGVNWVKPRLVCEVEFTEWTDEGLLRHPSFQGLREDKSAREIVRERAIPVSKAPASANRSKSHKQEENRGGVDPAIAGVTITHPDRVLYPEQGLTKLGLARYYESIAEWILPYISGRPLTLVRCPQGRKSQCFYQKHLTDAKPPSLRSVAIQEKDKVDDYVVVDDLAGVISLVQLGVLEIHPWGARAEDVEGPDQMVFDLDPGPGVAWKQLIQAAHAVRDLIAHYELKSFVRTSGGKGLHVVVPLKPASTWDVVKAFAKEVAFQMQQDDAAHYIATSTKAKRNKKIFVDYLRNSRGATAVASFSTRAREGAPVAMPLRWEELGKLKSAHQYSVSNALKRLSALSKDPWEGFFKIRQTL